MRSMERYREEILTRHRKKGVAARSPALCILAILFLLATLLSPLGTPAAVPAAERPYVDDGRYDYGLSQPNPNIKVKVELRVEIPTRDGVKLVGDVYRPDVPGRFPVIMSQAPYPRNMYYFPGLMPGVDDLGGADWKYFQFEQADPHYWVPRGYAYVTVSTRGYGGMLG